MYNFKSNEGFKYETYILFIYLLTTKGFPFTNHVFKLCFSKKW
jgi:hypothetical protein